MKLSLFDYHLPKEFIAQEPVRPRDLSRLMVLERDEIIHDRFYNLSRYLNKGDVIVFNNTKVMKARLKGKKGSGGVVELTLLSQLESHDTQEQVWKCLLKGKKLKENTIIHLPGGWKAKVLSHLKEGMFSVQFISGNGKEDFSSFLKKHGHLPLPPYIKRKIEREEEYQTIFAKEEGSVAAPTAGLHFTKRVFRSLEKKGVLMAELTLHVGPGTFFPVKTEEIEKHKMHTEWYTIDTKNAEIIKGCKERGGRVIAVGTTTLRVLETISGKHGELREDSGFTELFIYPGYSFSSGVNALITNFHLPKSTLLMLVSAFFGRERILRAYEEGKRKGYRFFSFGDAMMLWREI